jgi:hypothetical protein
MELDISQQYLGHYCNKHYALLDTNITGNKTWIYLCKPESKWQSNGIKTSTVTQWEKSFIAHHLHETDSYSSWYTQGAVLEHY